MLEKYILKESDSPFVVKLNSCFQTVSKVFIVMEYMEGGDLLRLLKKYNTFPEEWTVFLAAEIVLGLEYLHEKMNVIYRDLKPENIMLTRSGHIKLIDFGLSKYLKTNQKAQTFAGTPEYLAPEMFLKKGHNKAVDLWSLGIIIFQMLIGRTPFKVCKKNINKLKSQIIENRPDIPAELSHNARDLICKLLQTNPECRYYISKTIDWESMGSKKSNITLFLLDQTGVMFTICRWNPHSLISSKLKISRSRVKTTLRYLTIQ